MNNNRKYVELINNVGIFALGTVGSKLIVFFLIPLYTNVLSSAEYGLAELVFTSSELIRPFISLAIYNGLLRYGMSESIKKEDAFKCSMIIFGIGSLGMILLTPSVALYETLSEWKWYLCAYTIAVFMSKNILIYLKVKDQNKKYAVCSIIQAAMLAGFNILTLVFFKWGINGYLLSNILTHFFISIIAFLWGRLYKDLKIGSYKLDLMKVMIRYSLPFIATDISWFLIHSSDKYMIERMIGTAELGIYTAASKVPLMVSSVVSIFTQAWSISAVKEYETENDKQYYSNVFNYYIIINFGISIFLVSIIKPFMSVYVGADFSDSWHYVPLLIVATIFSSLAAFLGTFYSAIQKTTIIMWSTILAGIINVVLNYIFIDIIGIWGAIIGTVSAYFLLFIVRIKNISRYLQVYFNKGKLILFTLLVFIQALVISFEIELVFVSLTTFIIFFSSICKDCIYIYRFILSKQKN